MGDEFLDKLIDRLESQLETKKKTPISIIKRKKAVPVIKDISGKLDSISQIQEEEKSNSPDESEARRPQKVIKWL